MRINRNNKKGAKVGRAIGGVIGGAIDLAVGTVEEVGRVLLKPLTLSHRPAGQAPSMSAPGAPPGIESVPDLLTPPRPGEVHIQCIDYSRDRIETFAVEDLEAFLAAPRPAWSTVRWINVDELHPYVVNKFKQAFDLHTLAAEDVLHVRQRPKLEQFDNELFIVTRMLELVGEQLVAEQVTIFFRPNLLISFQEAPGDVWEPARQRLQRADSRLRGHDASFLLHALLDAEVDQCFPILESYGDLLEGMEVVLADRPTPRLLHDLHAVKRQLAQLRRVMWPMREVANQLQSDDLKLIPKPARAYFRDVYDHTVQVIDLLENYRDIASGMTDLYMSAMSHRLSEIMKVLTMIATIFVPLTFLAGVYGMNYENIPELRWKWFYPAFWGVCLATAGGLLYYFYRKGWLGRRGRR